MTLHLRKIHIKVQHEITQLNYRTSMHLREINIKLQN